MQHRREPSSFQRYFAKNGAAKRASIFESDIVGYAVNDNEEKLMPLGEFYPERVTSPSFDVEKAKVETDSEVVARIAATIREVIKDHVNSYIKENFDHPENYVSLYELEQKKSKQLAEAKQKDDEEYSFQTEIDSDKRKKYLIDEEVRKHLEKYPCRFKTTKNQNSIEPIVLPEFIFYPSAERGPLSVAGFNELIDEIEKIARVCPENFQMILGTVAVNMDDHTVNTGIFVECGNEPVIVTFHKALPSEIDPIYPNTSPFIFNKSIPTQLFLTKLLAAVEEKNATQVLTLCESKDCEFFHADLQPLLTKIKSSVSDVEQMTKAVEKFITVSSQICDSAVASIPFAALGGPASGLMYGCNVVGHTAGKEKYDRIIEICKDHLHGTGLFGRAQQTASLSSVASHTVLSGSADVQYRMTPRVVQSDTWHSPHHASITEVPDDASPVMCVSPRSTTEVSSPRFGSRIKMDSYGESKLQPSLDKPKVDVDFQRQVDAKLRVLRSTRETVFNRQRLHGLNEKISNYIVMPLIRVLEKHGAMYSFFQDELEKSAKDSDQAMLIIKKYKEQIFGDHYKPQSFQMVMLRKLIDATQNFLEQEKIDKENAEKRIAGFCKDHIAKFKQDLNNFQQQPYERVSRGTFGLFSQVDETVVVEKATQKMLSALEGGEDKLDFTSQELAALTDVNSELGAMVASAREKDILPEQFIAAEQRAASVKVSSGKNGKVAFKRMGMQF